MRLENSKISFLFRFNNERKQVLMKRKQVFLKSGKNEEDLAKK